MQFKLANIVLDPGDFLAQNTDLLFRSAGAPGVASAEYDESQRCLAFTGLVDFTTYFNALSLAKWRQYASLDNAAVYLELAGDD